MFRKAISLAFALAAVVIVSSTANTQAPGGGPGAGGGAPAGTAGGLTGHYRQLKFTLAPGEIQTQPFVFPVNDVPIGVNFSSSAVQADCGNGLETVGPVTFADAIMRDSNSGRIALGLNYGTSDGPTGFFSWNVGACASGASGGGMVMIDIDSTNNVMTLSYQSSESQQVFSPVIITMTMWY